MTFSIQDALKAVILASKVRAPRDWGYVPSENILILSTLRLFLVSFYSLKNTTFSSNSSTEIFQVKTIEIQLHMNY